MSRSRTPFNGAPTFDCRVAKLAAYERFRSLDEFGTLRRLTMTPIFTVLATEQAVCITDIDGRGSSSGVLLKMEVGIRKRAWQRV